MAKKRQSTYPAEWEVVIKCSCKKNECFLEVIERKDVISFKSTTAFPEYKAVIENKIEEEMTEKEKSQQKALSEKLGLSKRKVTKVYWSEIVMVKFEKANLQMMLFKYNYNEEFRKAVFCAPRRLKNKDFRKRE